MDLSEKYLKEEIDKTEIVIEQLERSLWLNKEVLKVFEKALPKE